RHRCPPHPQSVASHRRLHRQCEPSLSSVLSLGPACGGACFRLRGSDAAGRGNMGEAYCVLFVDLCPSPVPLPSNVVSVVTITHDALLSCGHAYKRQQWCPTVPLQTMDRRGAEVAGEDRAPHSKFCRVLSGCPAR
uniref:Uncharacterized protein n=1 Tax=Triticum urartu TaxID=4572 RepID=A0A8R7K006_TRIUA